MTNLLLCLIGILACFILGTVARVGIIGGELVLTNIKKFSYQVSIVSHINSMASICGGGIIDEKFILTAARCVLGKNLGGGLFVVAGTAELNDRASFELEPVKKIFWPTRFDEHSFKGDIAVLMLNDPLRLPHHRNWKLHLPHNNRETYEGVIAEIAGFGWNRIDSHGHGESDKKLRFAQVEVARLDWVVRVPEDILFARLIPQGHSRSRAVSAGDTGSPLVYNGTVIGILCASMNDTDETQRPPGTYIRTSYYLNFIRNATRNIETDDMATLELVL